MVQRGRVLRDTSFGPGLIAIGDKQIQFQLEGIWRSQVPPKPNMAVDVELSESGEIAAVYPVDEAQLAEEQRGVGFKVGLIVGTVMGNILVRPVLSAIAVIAIGWFFFDILTIRITNTMSHGVTFWELLKSINSGNAFNALQSGGYGSTGLYGLAAIATLAGPLGPKIWKSPTAQLGFCLPLVFMIFVSILLYSGIHDGISSAGNVAGAFGGAQAQKMAEEMAATMINEAMKAISLGAGAYLSLIASAYLAFLGVKKYLVAKAS